MDNHQINFGELKGDEDFVNSVTHFQSTLKKIDSDLKILSDSNLYDSLSTSDKVQFDLYISYCLNSLFWMYLRTKGEDPNKHGVKNELARVREYMLRNKQTIERITLRPRLDTQAAKRFIKSGLWEPKDTSKNTTEDTDSPRPSVAPPTNKKIKFETDVED